MASLLPPQDELLRLTGSTNNPVETITTTANGTGAYYGPNRTVPMYLMVSGAVTGTSPTLDVKFQDSVDGVTYADMGVSFAQVTTTMNVVTGSLADFPKRAITTTATRPYVRVVKTLGGTSPSFVGLAVLHGPAVGNW